ncbi:uncharacterized protein N7498_006377 [Penicillium cinerascens]|uniref:Ankyrin repeat domain-containing protein n=1 Tax=Penicillium cinerascens TaxID=70096 RepID=A0A9W9MI50_9EURO|nr:uncharacterized protein N7498_006377 [Penicillium cinerascens]KAJ5201714.1 hypothetical protein N7498_006377 [Penicillium cinerascens]
MYIFCVSGDIQNFREILDSPRSFPDRSNIYDLSAMMIEAIKRNSAQFITELLHRGMLVDPLYALEAIKLLDYKANPNRQYIVDLTPLSLAVESAPISVINLMLSYGGNVRKGQLLYYAIERRSDTIEVLKLLIKKGAPINITIYEDYPSWALFHFIGLSTPLYRVSELGKADLVSYLVSKGAN